VNWTLNLSLLKTGLAVEVYTMPNSGALGSNSGGCLHTTKDAGVESARNVDPPVCIGYNNEMEATLVDSVFPAGDYDGRPAHQCQKIMDSIAAVPGPHAEYYCN
jgi:hypothetical protein